MATKRKLDADKQLEDFGRAENIDTRKLNRSLSKRLKEVISDSTSTSDYNVVTFSALLFQSTPVVGHFQEYFQREWETMQADNQLLADQPIVF